MTVETLLIAARAVFLLFSFALAAVAFTRWRLAAQTHTAQLQANHLLSASRIAQEHAAILACIEREDVDGAVASVTQHIEQACARLVAYVEAGVRTP